MLIFTALGGAVAPTLLYMPLARKHSMVNGHKAVSLAGVFTGDSELFSERRELRFGCCFNCCNPAITIRAMLERKKDHNWWSKIVAGLWHLPLAANVLQALNEIRTAETSDDSVDRKKEKTSHSVPRRYSLDNFVEIQAAAEGISVTTLAPLDTIHIETAGGNFRLYLLDPEERRVLLEDDEAFAKPIEATVSGSTQGGSMLKMGWIGIGLFLELHAGALRLTTPVVLSLRVERDLTIPFAA